MLEFTEKFTEFQLDIVGFLAILGEGSVSVNYQVATLSYFTFLPRLLPAPQAFIRPARPLRLDTVPASVVGVRSGNLRHHVYRIPHIILPGEKLMTSKCDYTVRRVRLKVKGGDSKEKPLITARTFGLLSMLSVMGCVISFVLLGLSIHFEDGWALLATILLSCLSSVLGVACKWDLKMGERQAERRVPKSDVIVCYPNGSFLIVKCSEAVARALFFAPERCKYLLGSVRYRALALMGTMMLMFGVVALGNANIKMQLAFGASYLLLNAAYWVVAAMPEKLHWEYSALDIKQVKEVEPDQKNFTKALWEAIKLTKSSRWARIGQVAPDTKAWDEWLQKADDAANSRDGLDPKTWNPGVELSHCINGSYETHDDSDSSDEDDPQPDPRLTMENNATATQRNGTAEHIPLSRVVVQT